VVQMIPGQGAPARPLTAMPYSPSLDVTSLDRTVDPCVDFYKFSCGGWETHNPIPADQASWSVYAKLANENQQFLWGILAEDAQAENRTPVQQKVGDYFAACMNTGSIDALGDKPVRAELAEIDGLTTRSFTEEELARAKDNILNSFLFRYDTREKVLAERERLEFYGYPADYLESYKAALEKVTLADLDRVAKKYIHPDKLAVLVVGNGPEIKPGLDELKLGPVETVDITIPMPKPKPKQP